MKEAGVEASSAELTFIAKNEVSVSGKEAASLLKLLDALEENDDIQKVHSNADIDEETLAQAE
jgi:transcriptional/translational regulatory protein YebC/TACO1